MITVNTFRTGFHLQPENHVAWGVLDLLLMLLFTGIEHIDWLKMVSPTTLYAPNSLHALMQMRVCVCARSLVHAHSCTPAYVRARESERARERTGGRAGGSVGSGSGKPKDASFSSHVAFSQVSWTWHFALFGLLTFESQCMRKSCLDRKPLYAVDYQLIYNPLHIKAEPM